MGILRWINSWPVLTDWVMVRSVVRGEASSCWPMKPGGGGLSCLRWKTKLSTDSIPFRSANLRERGHASFAAYHLVANDRDSRSAQLRFRQLRFDRVDHGLIGVCGAGSFGPFEGDPLALGGLDLNARHR